MKAEPCAIKSALCIANPGDYFFKRKTRVRCTYCGRPVCNGCSDRTRRNGERVRICFKCAPSHKPTVSQLAEEQD